jgi:copper transport protein
MTTDMKGNHLTALGTHDPCDRWAASSPLCRLSGLGNANGRHPFWLLHCHLRGRVKPFVLGLLVLLSSPSGVFAHAVPRATQPAANAVLHEAPREIAVRFSERVDARASSLQVFDAHGTRVDDGKASVTPGDPWLYRLALPPLGAGVYTVSWRVMSADDGHVTDGAYVFAVGGTGISPPTAANQVIPVTGWYDALVRWLGMLGAVAMMGLLTASLVFWRRRPPRVPPPLGVLPWLVVLLFSSGVALFARLQRLPVESSEWAGFVTLMSSGVGRIAAAKIVIVLLLLGVLIAYWRGSRGRTWLWSLALLLTALLLLGDAWVSHVAAVVVRRELALTAELAHLLGVVLWVGGLGYFATLFWRSAFREKSPAAELAWAIPAFSLLAVGAVGLLTISGLYLAQSHLSSLGQLLTTPYGRILLAKLGVAAFMAILGGYHQFVVHPHIVAGLERSGRSVDPSAQLFRKTLGVEAVLGLLALLLAAFLGTTSPPSTTPLPVAEAFRQVRAVEAAQLTLEVSPLRPGPNAIRLTVTGQDGQALPEAIAALVQLQASGSNAAPLGFALQRESAGVFVKDDVVLGIEGTWKGQVTVQRRDAYDLSERFELVLSGQPEQHVTSPSAAASNGVMILIYVGIVGLTIALLLISKRRLSSALRRLDVPNQHRSSHPERGSHDTC